MQQHDVINKLTSLTRYVSQKHIATAIIGLMMVWCLWTLAQLTWFLVGAVVSEPQRSASPVTFQPSVRSTNSYTALMPDIAKLHLFGEANAKPVSLEANEEVSGPETQLPLTLKGVYALQEPTAGTAIIESNNKQKLYFVGDTIDNSNGSKLHKVLVKQVVLQRGALLETLSLETFDKDSEVPPMIRPPSTDTSVKPDRKRMQIEKPRRPVRNDEEMQERLKDIKAGLSQGDLSKLNQLMSYAPHTERGEMVGLKVTPGSDRRLFAHSGLRRNDIIVNINGMALDDPDKLLELQNSFAKLSRFDLIVRRGTEEVPVTIDLNGDQ